MVYYQLFVAFFRSGILGYGGGPAAIPLVQKEVVDIFKWMDNDEFGDVLAIGNALPGPINTKMAGYIGYRVAGIPGMLVAISSSIVPTIFLMIVILTSLASFKDQAWVEGATNAVVPVVGVMMAVLTWQFVGNSNKGLGVSKSIILLIISFLITGILDIHPAFIIVALLLFALTRSDKSAKKKEGGHSL